jgi:aminopeptidase-like protein
MPPHAAAIGAVSRTARIDALLRRLFPLPRSLAGPANRATLEAVKEIVPIRVLEVPSGTPVFDWEVPKEWLVREAWIKDAAGTRIVDFAQCNVHLVGYSEPVRARLRYEELLPRLHFREDLPEAIPYRTSYYRRDWGFCLSHRQFRERFRPGESYEVCIDAELREGSMPIGELLVRGRSAQEVLISTYLCHPSLANDNLSGVVMTAFLAEALARRPRELSYRIVFLPETIGAIAYCALNAEAMRRIDAGFVVTCVGGPGPFYYKQSWQSDHYMNAIAEQALGASGERYVVHPFDIHGSDERQYSAQGFRINTVSIGRNRYYEYPQYHTSLDNLDYVSAQGIERSLQVHLDALERLEAQVFLRSRVPGCEPMLSKRGLYPATGGALNFSVAGGGRTLTELDLVLWLFFLCDGRTPLSAIARRLGVEEAPLARVAGGLAAKGALEIVAGRLPE